MIKQLLKAFLTFSSLAFAGNSNAQWLYKNISAATDDYTCVDYSTANRLWIGGFDGLFYSNNGGSSFTLKPLIDPFGASLPGTLYDIHVVNDTTAIATGFFYLGNNELILKTTNAGGKWNIVNNVGATFLARLNDLDFPTSTVGYCVGYNGRILKSTDGGDTWNPQSSGTTAELFSVKFFNASEGIAVGDGIILHTSNGGTNWTGTAVNGTLNSVYVSGTTAFAVGDSTNGAAALIMKSTNSGAGWNFISNPFNTAKAVFALSADTIVVSTITDIYRSCDGGQYWDKYAIPNAGFIVSNVQKIDFLNSQNGYIVGVNKYAAYTTNGGSPLKPFIDFEFSNTTSTACQGDVIAASNHSNPAYSFAWYYDNSLTSAAYNPSFTFTTSGNHTIKLVATLGSVSDSTEETYYVYPAITVTPFTINLVNDTLCKNQSTTVQVLNSDASVYYSLRKGIQVLSSAVGNGGTLSFGTGNLQSTTVFNVIGSESNSCFSDSVIVYDSVIVRTPDASLFVTVDLDSICYFDSTTVHVQNTQSWVTYQLMKSGNPVGAVVAGNGGTIDFPTGSTNGGGYSVLATSDFGCTITLTNTVSVVPVSLFAYFDADKYAVLTGDTIHFANNANGTTYQWDFGTGASIASSNAVNPPPVVYSLPGQSVVSLIATYKSGCKDTVSKTIYVCNQPPSSPAGNCLNGYLDGKYMVTDYYLDSHHNSYITGYYYNNGNLEFLYFVAKTDSIGNVIWIKEGVHDFSTKGSFGTGIVADSAGNAYLCGHYTGYFMQLGSLSLTKTYSTTSMFVVKYDASGNEQWVVQGICNQFNVLNGFNASDIVLDNNTLYITGKLDVSDAQIIFSDGSTLDLNQYSVWDAYMLLLDTSGLNAGFTEFGGIFSSHIIGTYSVNNSGQSPEWMLGANPKLKVLPGGDVAVAATRSVTNVYDSCYFGLNISFSDADDELIYGVYNSSSGWKKAFSVALASSFGILQEFTVDSKGNIYFTGNASDTLYFNNTSIPLYDEQYASPALTENYLIKCDSSGNPVYLTHSRFNYIHDLECKQDNHLVYISRFSNTGGFFDAAGYPFAINSHGGSDYAIVEYDQNGNVQYAQREGSDSLDFAYYFELDECDDAYICASVNRMHLQWPYPSYCSNCPDDGDLEIAKFALDGSCAKVNCSSSLSDVWPGDADNNGHVDNYDIIPLGFYMNQTGNARAIISNAWGGQLSFDWQPPLQFNGNNRKHADCNGDGTINFNDTVAVRLNYGNIRGNPYKLKVNSTGADLYFITNDSVFDPNDTVKIEVWTGTSTQPVDSLYSIGFQMTIDPNVFVNGTLNCSVTYNWMCGLTNCIKFSNANQGTGQCDGTISKTDTAVSGYGKIADISFIASPNLSANQTLTINLNNYHAYNPNGDSILFNVIPDSVVVTAPNGVGKDYDEMVSGFCIFPNPGSTNVSIVYELNSIEQVQIKLYNMLGTEVQRITDEKKISGKHKIDLNLTNYSSGIYFIELKSGESIFRRKLVKQ